MYYCVVVEWDGDKPPTTFYNRMRALGLRVGRGADKSDSPMTRRAKLAENDLRNRGNNTGSGFESVVAQEGFFLTVSEQLATSIANYAKEHGAKNVLVLNADVFQHTLTSQDAKCMQVLESKLGKRGRPSTGGDEIEWAITCREEAKTFITANSKAVNCPHCGSPRINYLPGAPGSVSIDSNWDIMTIWKRTRFIRGSFEIVNIDPQAGIAPDFADPAIQAESLTVRLMNASADLRDDAEAIRAAIGLESGLRVLDLAFLGRTYSSPDVRRLGRVRAVTELLSRGVSSNEVSIIERTAEIDILDGSYNEPTQTAGLWMIAKRQKK